MEPKEPKNIKIQIFDKSLKSLEICQKNLKKQEFLSLNFPSPVILRVWEDTRRCVGGSAGPVCKMAAHVCRRKNKKMFHLLCLRYSVVSLVLPRGEEQISVPIAV